MIVTVDPSASCAGVACWSDESSDDGLLIHAFAVRGKSWQEVAEAALVGVGVGHVRRVVVEVPRVYDRSKAKGVDPNDLITLALAAGATARALSGGLAIVETCYPSDWKGQLPKDVSTKRTRAIVEAAGWTDRVELPARAPSLAHNVWDAVGLGLWYFSRRAVARGA